MAETDRTILFNQTVEGCIIAGGMSSEAFKSALKYTPRDDDFFIATYPKCGTTWTQQIVYLIYNEGKPVDNAADFFKRTPFLEMFGIESGEKMPRPGAIKVHLPYHLTPHSDKAKYLYVVRNPKDVAVSFYHHAVTDSIFTFQEGTFDRFFDNYISGNVAYGDYFDHVLGWYEHRNDPNIMLLTYEELKNDLKSSVLKIAKFMGETWFDLLQNNSDVLENVLKYSSLEFMKTILNNNFEPGNDDIYPGLEHVIQFSKTHRYETDKKFELIRTGKVGGWRKMMTEDQVSRLDERIEKKLKGTDLYSYWKQIDCI